MHSRSKHFSTKLVPRLLARRALGRGCFSTAPLSTSFPGSLFLERETLVRSGHVRPKLSRTSGRGPRISHFSCFLLSISKRGYCIRTHCRPPLRVMFSSSLHYAISNSTSYDSGRAESKITGLFLVFFNDDFSPWWSAHIASKAVK